MNYFKVSIGIFIALAASRFIPHPPNFTSLLALSFYVPALLGARYIPVLLIGFVFTVFLVGYFKFNKNLVINFIKLAFATSFIYIFGMLWLGYLVGWEKPIFELGAKPFLLAELFKILLLTLIARPLINFKESI